ncbi:hypothetical protein BH11PSE10_BH11PSE10_08940 [soil metagenome]
MLRALLAGAILLNALFFCWTQGWLDEVVGIKARGDREPERMARQLHPERVQLLLPPSEASAALAGSKRACLVLGPLDGDAALAAASQALAKAAIIPADWQDQASELAGVWAVATIRLPSKDFQARKEETYKKLKISYEDLAGPPNEMPSLVLSRHASEKAAAAALENFSQRALKGLRVLPLQIPGKRHNLVFAEADTALQAKLAGLLATADPALPIKPCAAGPAAESSTSPAASAAAAPASPAPSLPAPAASASSR